MALLFTSLLFSLQTSPNGCVIAETIDYIVNDFLNKSCDLSHKKIILYSSLPEEETRDVLQEVKKAFPILDISYQTISPENKKCSAVEGDVGIKLPDRLWNTHQGTFKCSFQSNLENIFGTLEFTTIIKAGSPTIGTPLLSSTVIGYPMPKIKN